MMDWLADEICWITWTHLTQWPIKHSAGEINFQIASFSSVGPVLTCKMSDDPSQRVCFSPRVRQMPVDPRQRRVTVYQSASASAPASTTCPTLSVSEHIFGSRPKSKRIHWATGSQEGFFMGHYVAEERAVNEAITASAWGLVWIWWGVCFLAVFWVYSIISYHSGSCKCRMSLTWWDEGDLAKRLRVSSSFIKAFRNNLQRKTAQQIPELF